MLLEIKLLFSKLQPLNQMIAVAENALTDQRHMLTSEAGSENRSRDETNQQHRVRILKRMNVDMQSR